MRPMRFLLPVTPPRKKTKAAALALVAGALMVSATAHAQKQKKEDWESFLRDYPGAPELRCVSTQES